jgi:hypothetical protein
MFAPKSVTAYTRLQHKHSVGKIKELQTEDKRNRKEAAILKQTVKVK